MSRDVIALVAGTLLAIAALAFVLYPLFVEPAPARRRPPGERGAPDERDGAIDALREIEFDRATGKLSDADYAELKTAYTQLAVAAMRAEASAAAASERAEIDPAEAAIRKYREQVRACARCGPRPEPDAVYCSSCGAYLDGRCGHCGAAVTEPGAAYCVGCGRALAA